MARGSFHPVVPVCATTGIGVAELLEVLVGAFPSPLEHPLPTVTDPAGKPHDPITANPDGPLAAEVVRTAVDSYVGRVSLVRVFSGTLRPERPVHVSGHGLADRGHDDHDNDERVAHIYSPLGATLREVPYCVAGDLCALTKVGSAETGDTVSAPDDPILMDTVADARTAAAGRRRRPHPQRRGRAVPQPVPAGGQRSDAADGTQRRDPPTGAVVHGRGARGRRAGPAEGRRRRGGHRAGEGRVPGDVRAGRQGARPAREAVRRARPVRRVRHPGRAAAPWFRFRVRRQDRRRRRAAPVHPERREGRAGPAASTACRPAVPWWTCG